MPSKNKEKSLFSWLITQRLVIYRFWYPLRTNQSEALISVKILSRNWMQTNFREKILELISLAAYEGSQGGSFLCLTSKSISVAWLCLFIGIRLFQGELQYFIGVQLDGSDHMEPLRNRLSERTEQQSAILVLLLWLSSYLFF